MSSFLKFRGSKTPELIILEQNVLLLTIRIKFASTEATTWNHHFVLYVPVLRSWWGKL